MKSKSLKSGKGSASANATALRSAKLSAKPWFDATKKADSAYVALATDLAIIDGKAFEGEDMAAKRKSFRRAVRNAIKGAYPIANGTLPSESDWQVVDKDYILPHNLLATLDDKGVGHVTKFVMPTAAKSEE